MLSPTATLVLASLSGGLLLGCGNFCDAYPEACDAPVGGAGGSNAGPFEVEVSLTDYTGEVVRLQLVLVSNADGEQEELLDTGATGKVKVQLSGEGHYISLLYVDGEPFVFTALAVPDAPELVFQLPPPAPTNPKTFVAVDLDCANICLGNTELSLSCHAPAPLVPGGDGVIGSIDNYVGCSATDAYEGFVVAYTPAGKPTQAATTTGNLPIVFDMPDLTTVEEGEVVDFQTEVLGDALAVTRGVRVPHMDRPGYGFRHDVQNAESSVTLSLVAAFVPRALATFDYDAGPGGSALWRQQLFDPLEPGMSASFDTASLAIPEAPSLDDAAPTASYSLSDGPEGDAVQLVLRSATLSWVVSLPVATSGSFKLPTLPEDFASLAPEDVQSYQVLHVDLDGRSGYAQLVSTPIRDYGSDPGLGDLTFGTSNTL